MPAELAITVQICRMLDVNIGIGAAIQAIREMPALREDPLRLSLVYKLAVEYASLVET